jgi:hypothetical protein
VRQKKNKEKETEGKKAKEMLVVQRGAVNGAPRTNKHTDLASDTRRLIEKPDV